MGHTSHQGSHVAMKNGRSKIACLMAGLYFSNVQRSTIRCNNNTTYFEPSIFVYLQLVIITEFLCPVEPLYFSDEKSITVEK